MAVLRKEYYTQQNGVQVIKVILKPTKAFPEGGYFYCPREAEELVDSYGWHLNKGLYVIARAKSHNKRTTLSFHREFFRFYHGYDSNENYTDHINMVGFDNTDKNLSVVTAQQNHFNIPTRGYFRITEGKRFRAMCSLNSKTYQPFEATRSEVEACRQANYIEQVILREKLGDNYYMFDFKKYRRGSEDILDLERRGIISEEEATYRHILRYADNAWYYYRYGLQSYFTLHKIKVPQYRLNEYGFMIHPVTGQKLCPF